MQAIKDLIPFELKNIRSVRIRKFLSISLILGLLQLSSFTFQVATAPNANSASTGAVSSYVVSTGGGGGFGQSNCPTGSVIYQVHSAKNSFDGNFAMTNVHAYCYGLTSDGRQTNNYVSTTSSFGSATGTLENRDCGNSSKVISGARVWKTTNGYASGIELYCRDMPGVSASSDALTGTILGTTGSGGANYNDLKCPAGTVAIGLYMYSGSILDKFGFNCGPITGVTQNAITSVTLSLTSKTYPYSFNNLYVDSIVGGSGTGDFIISAVSNGTATGCAYSGVTISSSTSGTCTLTVTKNADTNYAATSKTETFTFNKASLTITASSPIVNLGDPIPTITPTYSGFVNSENASSAAFTTGLTAPTCTTSYTAASTADTSPATVCSGGSSTGYSFNYVSGKVFIVSGLDNAISLNGSNQYLVTPDNSNLDITGAFTIEAWVNPSNANARGTVVGKWLSYMLQAYDGKWAYWLGNSSTWSAIITDVPVVANEWHHIAITRAASTDSVNFYLDGNLVYTGTAGLTGTGEIRNTSSTFTIGSHNEDADFFPGKIDEVKVWNVVRSQSDIQTDLKTWGPANSSGLVAYYDFNEIVGSTTVYNRSSSTFGQMDLTSRNSTTISSVETSTVNQAYTVVTFPRTYLVASGGWKIPSTVSNIKSLVIAGGGAGGSRAGGGGGAGGYVFDGKLAVNRNETYSVVVGVGGIGTALKAGTNGSNSSFGNLRIAIGGGGGGAATGASNCCERPGKSGGSGGGASGGNSVGTTLQYSTHTYGSGNNGGTAQASGNWPGGGGGGANLTTGTGGNGSGSTAGKGGSGILDPIGGTSTCYATGGGGGIYEGQTPGQGGDCGGASSPNTNGGTSSRTVPAAAKANTGSGGGGTGWFGNDGDVAGGNGASGVVIISYITDTPTILIQPLSDTTTAGIVETFTVSTSTAPTPLTKSVQWQFTADTTTGTTGWTNVSTGTGGTTDTFTTSSLTKSMNKYRFRAIVTFSDTSTLSVVETSSVAILTINDSITITSDTSTIIRKYGGTQTRRAVTYSGGTTSTGTVGTSTSHTVELPLGTGAGGKIYLETSTGLAYLVVDTGTPSSTYFKTVSITDYKGAVSKYQYRIEVSAADTLTVQADTLTSITYSPNGMNINPTVTISGLVNSDTKSAVTFNYKKILSCEEGGLCNLGDTGPGGGVIFYDAGSNQSWGRYIEAAPLNWYQDFNGGSDQFKWCYNPSQFFFNAPSGLIPLTDAIGSGYSNRSQMLRACFSTDTSTAPGFLNLTTINGKNNWFLPTLSELDALNNYSNGALAQKAYWVSADTSTTNAIVATYSSWPSRVISNSAKSNYVSIRPMRYVTPLAYPYSDETTTVPVNAGRYIITPSNLTLANNVDTSNYVSINYQSSLFIINKANQDTLTLTSKLGSFNGGTSTLKLTTTGGSDVGTVIYSIVSGGSASGCAISLNVLSFTSAGTCKVVANKAATLNYLIAYSDTATITLSAFVSHQQTQTQLYPNMLPINGANSLETTTATVPVITSITSSGGGAYVINGSGFTGTTRVSIGGSDITFNLVNATTINISGAGAAMGPVIIECSDGRSGPVPFWIFTP